MEVVSAVISMALDSGTPLKTYKSLHLRAASIDIEQKDLRDCSEVT